MLAVSLFYAYDMFNFLCSSAGDHARCYFLQRIHTAGIFLYETFFEVDYDHRTHGRDWKLKRKRSNKSLRLYFFS